MILQECPTWSNWLPWAACSDTCGGGYRMRERLCFNGYAGQLGCHDGGTIEQELCNEDVSCFVSKILYDLSF